MALCLIVDDDADHRDIVAQTLRAEGYETACVGDGAGAAEACRELEPQIVLLDLGLPDADGLAIIPELLAASPLSRILVVTGRDSVGSAVAALQAGARHYLIKPWDRDELLLAIGRECRAVDRLEQERRQDSGGVYWGSNPTMVQLRASLDKLASSARTAVLIEGPTGAGKEVVARELHRLTAPGGLFVAVNCAGIPGELLESELFGHERGAFTGAESRRRGMVELARDGTLFLDEIAEMSPALQAKLLRYVEDQNYRRVGGEEVLNSRCRVVAATHRNLDEWVDSGRFRQDLYFRLTVVRLRLPPLSDRSSDIVPLAYALLHVMARSLGRPTKQLSPSAETAVVAYPWPGNVRELRNRLERALVLGDGVQIHPSDLELPVTGAQVRRVKARQGEADRLLEALGAESWNVARTARILGVRRHWLRYHMRKCGITRPDNQ